MAVYHILGESESFSRRSGGAAAQWIAGVISAAGLQHETVVVCADADDSWGFPYVWVAPEMGKISLLPRPLQHPIFWRRRARFYSHLLKGFASRLQPQDAIFVHNRPEMALAMVWAQQGKQQRNPVVLAMSDSRLAHAPRPMVRHVAGRMAKVAFPTEYLYHQAFEKYRLHMRTAVMPFGADEQVFYPDELRAQPELPQIAYVGPLTEQRGVHVLLEAMRLLLQRGVRVELCIVERQDPGESLESIPNRTAREEYLRRLQALSGPNVRIAPYMGLEHVADVMRNAVAVCCPSLDAEAFGLSNVQAMASGVPVAASCVGGIPEVFADGGGLLIPPGDPAGLAHAIERLLGRTGLSRLLRQEGYASYQRSFSWASIARSYTELIEGLPYPAFIRQAALPQ